MKEYELMALFDVDTESIDDNKNFISNTLKNNQCGITEEKDLGVRDLAYPINEKNRGHYYLYKLNANQTVIHEIEKAFKLYNGLLRYLFLRKSK